MASIVIDGKKVGVPDNLTEDELDQVATDIASTNQQQLPGMVSKIASAAYTPIRGYRAIGAGLATGDIQEAAAAAKPGYKPSSLRAAIGSGLGSALPTVAALGPLGPLGAAGVSAGVSATEELAEGSAPTAGSAVKKGALAGLMDLVVGGAGRAAAKFGKGLVRSALSAAKGTPISTTERVLEKAALNPSVKGTTEAVEKAADEVREIIVEGRKTLGKAVGTARKNLQLPSRVEQIEKDLLAGGGLHPLARVLKDANATIEVLSKRKEVYPMYIDWLDELKTNIRAHMKFSNRSPDPRFLLNAQEQALLADKVTQIDKLIARVEGGESLQKANKAFSEFMEDLGPLSTKLQTTGDTIELFRAVGKTGEKAGKTSEIAERISNVVGKSGAKKSDKLLTEIALNEYLNPAKFGYANPLRSGFLGLAGKLIESPEAVVGKRGGLAATRIAEKALDFLPFGGLGATGVARSTGIFPGIRKKSK